MAGKHLSHKHNAIAILLFTIAIDNVPLKVPNDEIIMEPGVSLPQRIQQQQNGQTDVKSSLKLCHTDHKRDHISVKMEPITLMVW